MPPLVVENQYGSNMNLMQMSVPDDVDLDELAKWMNVIGLSLEQLLSREELTTVKEAEVVDEWQRKYVYGRSLCDPTKVKKSWYTNIQAARVLLEILCTTSN
jgi:hypothetical protein